MKYYEIVCSVGVVGVCTEEGLFGAAIEDRVVFFGEISEREYNSYSDHDWVSPISKKRFTPHIEQILKLIPHPPEAGSPMGSEDQG